MNNILIICGATASGKTSLSIECAKLLNTEIISADSMNIYKGLDVGTAKPDINERQGIIHHLIDVVSPFDSFTVSDYKNLALKSVDSILASNKIPVICGGTGFYIDSILYDFSYGLGKEDPEIREYYKNMAKNEGNNAVYEVLLKKDYDTAVKLHPNDLKRVIRALEICHNGTKKSDIIDERKPKFTYKAYAIDHDREVLYDRINKRVDMFVANGLVDEVNNLVKMGVTINDQCMQGIGYKEVYSYLKGDLSLGDAIELIKLNTRHYAKRQITYFKRLDGLVWLKPDDTTILAKRIIQEL